MPVEDAGSMSFELDGQRYWLIELRSAAPAPATELTPAERAILEGIIAGHSALQIADQRGSSPRTVERQIAALYRKLRASSRADLLRRVRNRG